MSFGKLGALGRGFGHLGALGGASIPPPPNAPANAKPLKGADGAYLKGADGAYLWGLS